MSCRVNGKELICTTYQLTQPDQVRTDQDWVRWEFSKGIAARSALFEILFKLVQVILVSLAVVFQAAWAFLEKVPCAVCKNVREYHDMYEQRHYTYERRLQIQQRDEAVN